MKKNSELSCRLGKVGGQAVLEGVMMKSGDETCLAVRKEDGTIGVQNKKFISVRKKYKFLNIPILRGIVNFVEMMKLSMSTLTASAEMLGLEEIEPESKFEKWLTNKLGDKLVAVVTGIASVIGVVLALLLFLYVPIMTAEGIIFLTKFNNDVFRAVIEGVMKIGIFVAYIALVSLIPDIKRTFQYHGAEHKSIACYEKGLELIPKNAAACTRFHPRCGTSFIFVMLILSIILSVFVPGDNKLIRLLLKLALLLPTMGLGFEFIMFAGKHDNVFTRILSAPGLWMQRLTTKEPDESQLEVAIRALKGAMPEEFPQTVDETEVNGEKADNRDA